MEEKVSNSDYRRFIKEVDGRLEANLLDESIGDQQKQVETMMNLERFLIKSMSRYKECFLGYRKWINHITVELGNINLGKTYFREPFETYSKKIAPAIKSKNFKELINFHPNYQLIKFLADNWTGGLPHRCNEIYTKFLKAREVLIENNIPLAINRAIIFNRKVPDSHLSLMDFIGICSQGLIMGIDKYNGPYRKVFLSVCIGYMVGLMIENYNTTLMKIFPKEKKILYRANRLKHKMSTDDINALVEAVNKSFLEENPDTKIFVTADFLYKLMNSDPITPSNNIDNDMDEEDRHFTIDGVGGSELTEELVENNDSIKRLYLATKSLDIIEMKIISLKGVFANE